MNDPNSSFDDPALTITVSQTATLTREEQCDLTALLDHCVQPQAIAIDALMVIQRYRGWISDQTLTAIAQFITVSTAELDSIATFYNLIFRLPVAKIVLHPCNGMVCQLMGSAAVTAKISQCLGINPGQSDKDNLFTLIPLPCLGACDKAPVMIAAQQLFELIRPERVSTILIQLSDDTNINTDTNTDNKAKTSTVTKTESSTGETDDQ
ncbi:MAG: NADH-quinone oxidoreductase subunit NuoE [Gammaproteobacteria bacterium]|nr:NADH-quinone oxidoreductase subunit NuoE [Gammaproteobacteria bacterium]